MMIQSARHGPAARMKPITTISIIIHTNGTNSTPAALSPRQRARLTSKAQAVRLPSHAEMQPHTVVIASPAQSQVTAWLDGSEWASAKARETESGREELPSLFSLVENHRHHPSHLNRAMAKRR